MSVDLLKISAKQIEVLPRGTTVFFFAVGPLEDHGPHLPIGLDVAEAAQLCQIAARHLEEEMPGWVGVIMPTAPLGVDSNTTRIAITVRPHVLRDWLVDSCEALMRLGFRHFVCFSGNLGRRQLTAIEEAGKTVKRRGRWIKMAHGLKGFSDSGPELVSASSALTGFKMMRQSPFWPDPLEHGGKRDTSVALAIETDAVDPNYRTLPVVPREKSRWMRNLKRRRRKLKDYWGNPAAADSKEGDHLFFETLEEVFPKLRAVWLGANPQHVFKSYYSILPPNWSFFRAWMIAFVLLILIMLWLYINFPSTL